MLEVFRRHGARGAYNYWLEKNGPVKRSPESFRKQMAREFVALAKERYGHDIGASYAWVFFSFHGHLEKYSLEAG